MFQEEQYLHLDPSTVRETIAGRREESRSIDELLTYASEELGMEPDESNSFGVSVKTTPQEPIQPPEQVTGGQDRVTSAISGGAMRSILGLPTGTGGSGVSSGEQARSPVEKLEFEFRIQDVSGENRSGAIVLLSLKTNTGQIDYHALLDTPGDEAFDTTEYVFDGGEVVEANSWWSRFSDCVWDDCAGRCITGLWECWNGSWSQWWHCLVNRCGNCAIDCARCAACNCKWICKWRAGCCG